MVGKRRIFIAMLLLCAIQIITVESKHVRSQAILEDGSEILQKQVAYTGIYCASTDTDGLPGSSPVGGTICYGLSTYTCQASGTWTPTGVPCVETYCLATEAVFGVALDPIPAGQILCDKNNLTHYCAMNGTWIYLGAACTRKFCSGGYDNNNWPLPSNIPAGFQVCDQAQLIAICSPMTGTGIGKFGAGDGCKSTFCEPNNHHVVATNEPVPSGQIACGSDGLDYFCDMDGGWRSLNSACTPVYCPGGVTKSGKTVAHVIAGRSLCNADGTTYYCANTGNYIHTNFPCTDE